MPVRFTPSPPNAPRAIARAAAALLTVALVTACATDQPTPTGVNASIDASSRNGTPFTTEGLASPAWQLTARNLVSAANLAAVQATHVYPILGVAQYLAVQRAQAAINGGGRQRLEADRGAVAGASFVTMSYLFPASVQAFQDLLTAQANAGPGQPHPSFAAGEAIGRAVGAQIVARAIADHFNDPNTAVPPAGGSAAGFWTPNLPGQLVAGGTLPGTTPWFLTSSDQFKPDPHPPFGSTAFNDALAEIRQISDTRTAEQIRIASFWALSNGTPTTSGFWLAVPTDSGWVARHNLSERETTHLYALLSSTMFDAQIGCWDEKLRSWLVRPWKADPAITTFAPVGMPNHPSYPSGHSCLSSSAASVLSMFFPEHTAQLDAMVVQAGLSRMYGGIHYRFDITTGQTLGHNVGRFTIAQDASGNSVLTPH
jgi:membrane-associated phospholipid phosphatase